MMLDFDGLVKCRLLNFCCKGRLLLLSKHQLSVTFYAIKEALYKGRFNHDYY